jgi:hypothetical protein
VLFGCEVCSSGWLTLIGCGQYLLLMLSAGVVGVKRKGVRSRVLTKQGYEVHMNLPAQYRTVTTDGIAFVVVRSVRSTALILVVGTGPG